MKITLPYPPTGNLYWRIWHGRPVTSPDARRYKQGVKLRALTEGLRKPLGCPVVASLTFYRPRKTGDLDNALKVILDALNGIAWEDDSQIVEIHARREDDKSRPRVEVHVEAERETP